jgi:hypothetical protein
MKAAGLNPAMMYAGKGGSESGSGGGPTAGAPGNAIHTNALAQGLNSATQSAALLNDIRNTNADITMKEAQALNATASAAYSSSSAKQTNEQTAQLEARRDKNRAESTRDAGDADWENRNRAIRMLTTRAGVGAAVVNSADKAGKMLLGEGDMSLMDKKLRDYRENKALNKAGISGLGEHLYGNRGFNQ